MPVRSPRRRVGGGTKRCSARASMLFPVLPALEQHRGVGAPHGVRSAARPVAGDRVSSSVRVQPGQAILEGLHPGPEQPALAEPSTTARSCAGVKGLGR